MLAIVWEESPGTEEQRSPRKRTKGDLGIVQQKHTAHCRKVRARLKSWGKSPRVTMVTWCGENPTWCKSDGLQISSRSARPDVPEFRRLDRYRQNKTWLIDYLGLF